MYRAGSKWQNLVVSRKNFLSPVLRPWAAIGKKPVPGMHISNGSRDAQGRGTSLSSMECSDRQSKCPPIISASLAIWTSEAQMCCTSTLTQKRGTNAIITVRRRLNQERASPAM